MNESPQKEDTAGIPQLGSDADYDAVSRFRLGTRFKWYLESLTDKQEQAAKLAAFLQTYGDYDQEC